MAGRRRLAAAGGASKGRRERGVAPAGAHGEGQTGAGRAAMSVADAAAVGGRGWGRDGARRASVAVQAQRGEEEERCSRGGARRV